MARRKKNKTVEKPKIQEYEGFKLGDEIWYVRVDQKIKKGTVTNFHPGAEQPALTVIDVVDGRYHVSPIQCCSFDKKNLKNKKWNCKKS